MGYKVDQPTGAGAGVANTTRADLWRDQAVEMTDPAAGPESYLWVLKDKPGGSAAVLSDAATDTARLTPDLNGTYRVWLYRNGVLISQFVFRVIKTSAGVTDGWALPAFDEAKEEDSGGRGWAPALELIFATIKAEFDTATENATASKLLRRGADGVIRQIKTGIGAIWAGGLELINSTAATDGNQQWSPGLYLTGFSWSGAISGASTKQEWGFQNRTLQSVGDGVVETELHLLLARAAGAFASKANLNSLGDLTIARDLYAISGSVRSPLFRSTTNLDLYAGTDNFIRLYSDGGGTLLCSVKENGGATVLDFGTRSGRMLLGGNGLLIIEDVNNGTLLQIDANAGDITGSFCYLVSLNSGGYLTFNQTRLDVTGQIHSSGNNTYNFSATPTFDFDLGNHVVMAPLTANVTDVNASNPGRGAILTVEMTQDGTGGRTVAWGGAPWVFATGDDAPDLGADKRTVWTFKVDNDESEILCINVKRNLPAHV